MMNEEPPEPRNDYPPGENAPWALIEKFLIQPWQDITSLSHKIEKNEPLPPEECHVRLFYTGLSVPGREFIFLLKRAGTEFIPAGLSHLLLFPSGDSYLGSSGYFVSASDGFFTSIEKVRFTDEQLLLIQASLQGGEHQPMKNLFPDIFPQRPGPGFAALLLSPFFVRLENAYRRFVASGSITHYFIDLLDIFTLAFRERWIRIYPPIAFFSRFEEILTSVLDFDLQTLKEFIPARFSLPYPLAIKDREFILAFGMSPPGSASVGVSFSKHPELPALSPENAAGMLREASGARMSVCLELDPILDLFKRIIPNPFPWERDALAFFLGKAFGIIRGYNLTWGMSPVPLLLKPFFRRLIHLFRFPYDVLNLDEILLPRILLEELSRGVGGHNQHALIFLDQDQVKGILIIEIFHGGFRRLKILPAHTIIPPDDKERIEWLKTAKFELWNEEGWMNYAIAVDVELIRDLFTFLTKHEFVSPLKAPFAFFRLAGKIRKARKKEFLLYPRLKLIRLGRFTKKEGIFNISYRLLKSAVRRKRRQPV